MYNLFIRSKIVIFPLLFFVIVFFVFQKNVFRTVNRDFFAGFQKDSESLVLSAIEADRLKLDKKNWNLGIMVQENSSELTFKPYRSSVGFQEIIFSKLQKQLSIGFNELGYFPSAILAIVVVSIFYPNRLIYGPRYAWIFSFSLVLSPWVVAMARNLYWVEFLFLLPCLFATWAYATKSTKVRYCFFFLVFLTFFVKSLCGYEYITSITLLACSPFIIGPFFNGASLPKWKSAAVVFALCVLGFFSAIIIHANMRGDTLRDGVEAIYNEDVKRRTYGDPSSFDPSYTPSLTVYPHNVVRTYIESWSFAPPVPGLPASFFKLLIVFTGAGLLVKYLIAHKTFTRDLVLVSYMSLIPLSWFIMALGHSYNHTHINYVLWYLGCFQAFIFVGINSSVVLLKTVPRFLKTLDIENF